MSFWLAKHRTVQATDTIQRFDPRFWTVDFPRPAMASVVTTAPDALRVDAVFQKANDLIGLIWESADRWDHPLLAYDTDRDYARLTLAFRWRSAGVRVVSCRSTPSTAPRLRSKGAMRRVTRGLGMCGYGTMPAGRRPMPL